MNDPAPEPADTGHEYDGIREHDNQLPRWWLMTLYGAIVFSFAYWIYFQTLGIGLGPHAAFVHDYDELQASMAKGARAAAKTDTDEALLALRSDAATVQRGHDVYTSTCLVCHGDKGQGVVGPNLTDAYWLHGAKPTDNMRTIETGVPAKGMPTWGPVLGHDKIKDVTIYLLTLRDTHAVGKPAEGVDDAGKAPGAP